MRLAIVCSTFFLAAGIALTASPLIQDPQILIDTGGDAVGISTGINAVQPCGNPTCSFDFIDDTPAFVVSFDFKTTINKGLTSAEVANFTCADPGGYFLGCKTNYDPVTGGLEYLFSGVNPADSEVPGDTEAGEHEGIPPQGHFIITLKGWTENEALFVDGNPPSLDGTFSTAATPEPAAALTLGAGLLFLAALWRRRRTVQ